MTLPPSRSKHVEPPHADEAEVRPHVVIVDDHSSVTRAVSALLKRSGFETTCFNSGTTVIDFVQERSGDGALPISAIILDIHMPDMSGLVVSQKLRSALGPAVPIIILSGDGSMETLNSLPHVGATHFFSKPIRAEQLTSYLRDLLDSPNDAA